MPEGDLRQRESEQREGESDAPDFDAFDRDAFVFLRLDLEGGDLLGGQFLIQSTHIREQIRVLRFFKTIAFEQGADSLSETRACTPFSNV
jgi:hypothetical protein